MALGRDLDHEELAERALTQSLPRGLSVARFTLAALGATTVEAAGRRCLEWPEAVSGSPQWDDQPHQPSRWINASRCWPRGEQREAAPRGPQGGVEGWRPSPLIR